MGETKPGLVVAVALAVVLAVGLPSGGLSSVATASHQSVSISSPPEGEQLFVGQAVTVNGTANQSVGSVALYVRGGGDWLLMDVNRDGVRDDNDAITVEQAGNWSVRNLVLADAHPVLSYPGNYQLGVVAANEVGENGSLPATLDTNRLPAAGGAQTVLRINRARLEGNFLTVGGELPTENAEVTVEGTARGAQELLVVLVDSRGKVATDRILVPRGNGSFEQDVALRAIDGSVFAKGPVTGYVLAVGRDDRLGDGRLPDGSNATLDALAEYVSGSSTTLDARQVRERLLDQTVDAPGSDDLVTSTEFRYAESSTEIVAVSPESLVGVEGIYAVTAGETLVVRGETNRLPDESTILVEATAGPTPGRLPLAWTDEWNLDGNWAVSMDTTDVEPGLYTHTVDVDGDTEDQVRVWILRPAGNVTPEDWPTTGLSPSPGPGPDLGLGSDPSSGPAPDYLPFSRTRGSSTE